MKWFATIDQWGRCTKLEVIPDAGGGNVRTVLPEPAGMTLTAIPGQPPMLTLFVQAEIELEGDVPIVQAVQESPRAAVLAWLATIDPKQIEQASLDNLGGFGGPSAGQSFIMALRADAEQLP